MREPLETKLGTLHRLGEEFFARNTVEVAKDLIGKFLVHQSTLHPGPLIGRIVETEAYRGEDPACHAHRLWKSGRKPVGRAGMLFAEPGTAYVYLNYGMHWLLNVVTEAAGHAGAVLLRALEPVEGTSAMQKLRPSCKQADRLCAGPGNLTRCMDVGPSFHGLQLARHPQLFFASMDRVQGPALSIEATPRIGISQGQDLLWRFTDAHSAALSGGRLAARPRSGGRTGARPYGP